MKAHLQYFSYVLRHKWWVLVAGLRTGAPLWRLVIHDYSKFTPAEWGPYARYFYGKVESDEARALSVRIVYAEFGHTRAELDAAFDRAWLHHQHANPHHWQHWLLRNDNPPVYYAVTSPNCLEDYAITEYVENWRELPEGPPAVWLEKCPLTPAGDAKVMVATRCCRAANAAGRALKMPEHFVREMVADWAGAGRAITGKWEVAQWFLANHHKMILHPDTHYLVCELLKEWVAEV